MPTYLYETIPADGRARERFEIVQRMSDAPLTVHPRTGDPVRRIVSGGLAVMGKPVRRSTVVNKQLAAATPCGCSRTALAQLTRPAGRGPRMTTRAGCGGPGGRAHRH